MRKKREGRNTEHTTGIGVQWPDGFGKQDVLRADWE